MYYLKGLIFYKILKFSYFIVQLAQRKIDFSYFIDYLFGQKGEKNICYCFLEKENTIMRLDITRR